MTPMGSLRGRKLDVFLLLGGGGFDSAGCTAFAVGVSDMLHQSLPAQRAAAP